MFFDGYTIWNVNLQSAIDECMKIVDDPSKIIVDVAICGIVETEQQSDTGLSIGNYLRGQDIKTEYNSGNSIDEIRRAYPTVNYRHLVFQEKPAGGLKELDFANATTWKMQ